ncbi:CPBP family intramembrane glutamic endopeptidase [Flavicella sediminum]|uniref:CPBP family intramembrane glutamic endopeptidase n=1 Tax=Flavicella sediminum TaxID=2585141 RepID=UPI001122DBA8|nr:CPBP family intramembrane glutamic endopeptidase [Flavicella sediminum]
MGYLEEGFKGATDWWRYIASIVLVLLGVFFGSIPLSFAIVNVAENSDVDATKLNDITYVLTLFDSNISLIYMVLPFVFGLVALFFSVKFIHDKSLTSLTTARKKMDWKRFFFSFGIWSFFVVFFFGIQLLSAPELFEWNFELIPFLGLFALALILIPIQIAFEEYVFRGYLMQGLAMVSKNRWFPLLVTSVLFGLMHYENPEIDKLGNVLLLYYVGTGLFLGVLALMDEGLELSLGFHAANNLVTALLVTADWTAFQTHSVFKDLSEPTLFWVFVPMLVLYPILLFLFSKKYKWNNWKEKLSGTITEIHEVEEIGI